MATLDERLPTRKVWTSPSFLSPDECAGLVRQWHDTPPPPRRFPAGRALTPQQQAALDWDARIRYPSMPWLADRLCGHVRDHVPGCDDAIDNLVLTIWRDGMSMALHSDYGAWQEFPRRHFAAVVFLNDDFEGGEHYFSGRRDRAGDRDAAGASGRDEAARRQARGRRAALHGDLLVWESLMAVTVSTLLPFTRRRRAQTPTMERTGSGSRFFGVRHHRRWHRLPDPITYARTEPYSIGNGGRTEGVHHRQLLESVGGLWLQHHTAPLPEPSAIRDGHAAGRLGDIVPDRFHPRSDGYRPPPPPPPRGPPSSGTADRGWIATRPAAPTWATSAPAATTAPAATSASGVAGAPATGQRGWGRRPIRSPCNCRWRPGAPSRTSTR